MGSPPWRVCASKEDLDFRRMMELGTDSRSLGVKRRIFAPLLTGLERDDDVALVEPAFGIPPFELSITLRFIY